MDNSKYCSYHKCEHPLENFGKDSHSKDGYRSICKEAFNILYNSNKKSGTASEEQVVKFFKLQYPIIYKSIQIKAIREDREFMDVLIESIKIEDDIMNFVNKHS